MTASAPTHYTLKLEDAAAKRIASKLKEEDRLAMKEWLVAAGIPENEIDIADTQQLLDQWVNHYDPKTNIPGMTNAKRNYYIRLDASLDGLLSTEGVIIAAQNPDTGALEEKRIIEQSGYVNVREVPNVRVLPFGTDNFGRDVLTELVKATGRIAADRFCRRYHCHLDRFDPWDCWPGISAA
jgi:peptide/nickel transport system permease protein